MSFSPRRVRSAPSVALYECRLHRFAVKPAAVLRSVEGRVRKWRGVQRWFAQCYTSARGEVVVQAVVERAASAARVDNLLQAWRKLVVKLMSGVVQVTPKQLKRGAWCHDILLDVRVMAEEWDVACAKLRAEAAAVDAVAVHCSYLEPALPGAPSSINAPPTAPPVIPLGAPCALMPPPLKASQTAGASSWAQPAPQSNAGQELKPLSVTLGPR